MLLPEIVRHINKCFTKKGIKEAQRGARKRTYQPRRALIKVPSDQVVKPEESNVDEELPQEKSVKERGYGDETTVITKGKLSTRIIASMPLILLDIMSIQNQSAKMAEVKVCTVK